MRGWAWLGFRKLEFKSSSNVWNGIETGHKLGFRSHNLIVCTGFYRVSCRLHRLLVRICLTRVQGSGCREGLEMLKGRCLQGFRSVL